MNIIKYVTPEIIFGCGALAHVGESVLQRGARKVFVVSDEGVINSGWVEKALVYLKAVGLDHEVYCNISSNPKDNEVVMGLQRYLETECDSILAVGGGSPTDVAKAIAILATNGGIIQDYQAG